MDNFTEKTSRMLAKKTSRRGFLGWLGKASVALVGGAVLGKAGLSVNAAPEDVCDCALRYGGGCTTHCFDGRIYENGDAWYILCQVRGWTDDFCYCTGGTVTNIPC